MQACLVAAWVKSGLWLTPGVFEVLDIELISDQVATCCGHWTLFRYDVHS